MFKKGLENHLYKNARNGRQRAIYFLATSNALRDRLEGFSCHLSGLFLKSLLYSDFSDFGKNSLKIYLKGVLRGLKGVFNEIEKIVQKSQKSQIPFSGFSDFLRNFRLQNGGI